MPKSYYQVAGLDFCIETNHLKKPFFNNYKPFQTEKEPNSLLFRMVLKKIPPVKNILCRTYYTDGGEYLIFIDDDFCDVVFKLTGSNKIYRLRANRKWTYIEADIDFHDIADYMVLNEFIMFSYIYSSAFYNTVLLHASCVVYNELGIAFMGASGVGKSTHSDLWIKNLEGTFLLNDDQPAIRFIDGEAYIYGTPWSGKTPCYRNKKVLLKGILTMEQAYINEIRRLTPLAFFQQLLASCSLIREDEITFDKISITLSALVKNIQAFHFKNKPDKEAVELSFYTLFGYRKI